MRSLLLLFAILCGELCVGDHFLKKETFEYGPFQYAPYSDGEHNNHKKLKYGPVPLPKLPIAVKYWGSWELIDSNTKEIISDTDMFLHHIMVWGTASFSGIKNEKQFLSGQSRDKRTWGPDLPDGYLVRLPADLKQNVVLHIVNFLNRTMSVSLRYTVKYFDLDHIPVGTTWVKCVALQHDFAILGNDAAHPIIENQWVLANNDGGQTIITAQGHVHQGGIDISLYNMDTRKIMCTAKVSYSANLPCYFGEWCPKCAEGNTPLSQTFIDTITFCPHLNLRVEQNEHYMMIARYDNKCSYDNVVMWYFLYVARDSDNM